MNKRATGAHYEDIAAGYLKSLGYSIISRNYRCRSGEIDIIALDGETVVFCEVKYRSGTAMGYPSEAVNAGKRNRIIRASEYFLLANDIDGSEVRYDVVEILGDKIRLLKDSFDAGG